MYGFYGFLPDVEIQNPYQKCSKNVSFLNGSIKNLAVELGVNLKAKYAYQVFCKGIFMC
jgi:hypothetical protein